MSEKGKANACSFCGRLFALKSSLKIHEIKHKKSLDSCDLMAETNISVHAVVKERSNICEFEREVAIQDQNRSRDRLHACIKCGKQYALATNLKTHMLDHHSKVPYYCVFCQKSFTSKSNLKNHMQHHELKQNLSCGGCGKCVSSSKKITLAVKHLQCDACTGVFLTRRSLKLHICTCKSSQSSDENLQSCKLGNSEMDLVCTKPSCLKCKKVFQTEALLKQHSLKKYYECDACSQSFLNCESLKTHLKSHTNSCHISLRGKVWPHKTKYRKLLASQKENELSCSFCQKTFTNRYSLPRHIRRVHSGIKDVQCEFCGKMFDRSHYKIHQRIHTGERPYNCEKCGASFMQRSHLQTHIKSHTGVKSHQCDICGKAFIARQGLTLHYRTHTGEKPYKCDICSKDFAHASSFRQHKLLHFPEELPSCLICIKNFSTKQQLFTHYRDHSDEELQKLDINAVKSYICQLCEKKFNSRNMLLSHYRRHSQDKLQKLDPKTLDSVKKTKTLRVKKLCCDVCGKRFSQNLHLQMHVRIHTGEKPHKCSVCHKAFRLKISLKNHQRIHTGERPFKCHVCDKRFVQQIHAKVHMVTHTGVKPYVCNVCGKAFAHNGNRKAHEKIHMRCMQSASLEENSVICSACGKEFPGQSEYDSHLKSCSCTTLDTKSHLSKEYSVNLSERNSVKIDQSFAEETSIVCSSDDLLASDFESLKSPVILSLSKSDRNYKENVIVHVIEDSAADLTLL